MPVPGSHDDGEIVVAVEQWMAELAERFLEHRREDVGKLRAFAAGCAFTEARSLGHNLKGTGRAYGFIGVSDIGAALEQAGTAGDAARIATLADELADYLGRVRVEYR